MNTNAKLLKLRSQAEALSREIKAAEATCREEIKQRAMSELERSGLLELDVNPAAVGAAIVAAIDQLRRQPAGQEQRHE